MPSVTVSAGFVLAPGDPIDLADLNSAKNYFGVVSTSEEIEIQRIITAVSAFIVTRLGWSVKAADYTHVTSGRGGTILMLPQGPVISVSSVLIGTETVLPATAGGLDVGYVRDGQALIMRGRVWDKGTANIQIAYRAGYETVPPALKQACVELALVYFRKRSFAGVSSRSGLGQEALSFLDTDMPVSVKAIIQSYSKVFLA